MSAAPSRIAVALSGGGYRAAAFSAGALLYLIDSGLGGQIAAISSVSGGSLTNAYFARNVLTDSADADGGDVPTAWEKASWLLAFLARADIISPVRMSLFAVLPAGLTGSFLAALLLYRRDSALVAIATGVIVAFGVAVVTFLVLYLQLRRSLELAVEWILRLPENAVRSARPVRPVQQALRLWRIILTFSFRRAVEIAAPRMTQLADIKTSYIPIFCCTDLATGSQFFVSTSFVAGVAPSLDQPSSSIDLVGFAPTLPVATAVAASAAFPVVFRPTVIDAATLGLPARRGLIEDRVVLADGGLYDNLGVTIVEAWLNGEMNAATLGDLGEPPDMLIVVDSGLPAYRRQSRRNLLRIVARSMDVIHQANSLSRKRELERLFGSGARTGSLVTIGDDPFQLAESCGDPARRDAILSWLKATESTYGLTRVGWRALAQQRNPGIGTNLKRLGTRQLSQLVLHGYAAMMARTVAEHGWRPASPERLPSDIESLTAAPFVGSFRHRIAWILNSKGTEAVGRVPQGPRPETGSLP